MPRLHDPVTRWRVAGWSSMAIGVIGLAIVAADSDHSGREIWVSIALAVFFAAWMWVLVTRRLVLPDVAPRPPAGAIVEPGSVTARRMLVRQAGFAAVVVLIALIGPPPVGIALGAGLWQLATAGALHRWERRTGRRLLKLGDAYYAR